MATIEQKNFNYLSVKGYLRYKKAFLAFLENPAGKLAGIGLNLYDYHILIKKGTVCINMLNSVHRRTRQ